MHKIQIKLENKLFHIIEKIDKIGRSFPDQKSEYSMQGRRKRSVYGGRQYEVIISVISYEGDTTGIAAREEIKDSAVI